MSQKTLIKNVTIFNGVDDQLITGKDLVLKVHEFALDMIAWLNDVRKIDDTRNSDFKDTSGCQNQDSIKRIFETLSDEKLPLDFRKILWHSLASRAQAEKREKIKQIREIKKKKKKINTSFSF